MVLVSHLHQRILRLLLILTDRSLDVFEGPQEEHPEQNAQDGKLHGLLENCEERKGQERCWSKSTSLQHKWMETVMAVMRPECNSSHEPVVALCLCVDDDDLLVG